MSLPSFTISQTPKFSEIIGDVAATQLSSRAMTSARIYFRCNVTPDDFVVWDGSFHRIRTIEGYVNTAGAIERKFDDGTFGPVKLLANDVGLNVSGIQWTIEIRVGKDVVKKWTINAPRAGTVYNLATAPPVPNAPVVGILRGPRSKVKPITTGPDAGKYQWFDEYGNPFGDPVELTDVISAQIAQVAATAAAQVVAPGVVDANIAARQPKVIAGSTPGMARYKIGDVAGPEFPANVALWGGIPDKPAVIGAGDSQSSARAALNVPTIVQFNGAWLPRPADPGPVIFVGGIAPGNEPPGVEGDVWIPAAEDGTVTSSWDSITGKPAVIAAGASAAAARAAIEVDAAITATVTAAIAAAGTGPAGKLLAPSAYLSGYYYFAAASQSVATSASLGNQTVRVGAWLVTQQVSIARFNAEVTVAGEAGSVFRIGVWAADGSGGMPGALKLDAGTIPGDGAVGVKEITLGSPLVLQPGLYYVGGAVQGAATTQPTMRTVSTPINPGGPMTTTIPAAGYTMNGYLMTGVSGGFGRFSGAVTSNAPARIGFKVA